MKKLFIILIAMLFIGVGGFIIYNMFSGGEVPEEEELEEPKDLPVVEKEEPKKKEILRSETTGIPLYALNEPENFFGVMVENSPPARPQTGIVDADIVYELQIEYRMTRFFALFRDEVPEKVGPMRSSRHYYLPLAESWNSPYYHLGASKFAYKELPDMKVPHFDSTGQGYKYMERSTDRKIPHNAYLMIDRIDKHPVEPTNPHFEFTEEDIYEGESIDYLELFFDQFTISSYKYNEEEKVYDRYLQKEPHLDKDDGRQIKAKNVFLLYADHIDMGTEQKHIDIDLQSEGDLEYFIEGIKVNGKWKYEEEKGIVFYDESDKIIKVKPGKTWIQVTDNEGKVKVTQSEETE